MIAKAREFSCSYRLFENPKRLIIAGLKIFSHQ